MFCSVVLPLDQINRFFWKSPRISQNQVMNIFRIFESISSREVSAETVAQKNHLFKANIFPPFFEGADILKL